MYLERKMAFSPNHWVLWFSKFSQLVIFVFFKMVKNMCFFLVVKMANLGNICFVVRFFLARFLYWVLLTCSQKCEGCLKYLIFISVV